MEHDVNGFGRDLARLQDERLVGAVDLERSRARLLDAALSPAWRPAPARNVPRMVASTAALALAAVVVWAVVRPAALAFQLGTQTQKGDIGTWIQSAVDESLPLTFSDGSVFVLDGQTRARVTRTGTRGADIIVAEGELHASVVPRARSAWHLTAGPFHVHVTGTKFDLAWQPARQEFRLRLREGKVVISGPVIGADRLVLAGQTIVVSGRTGTLNVTPLDAPAVPDTSPDTSPQEAPPAEVVPPPAKTVSPRLPRASFQKLARADRYPEALAAAERAGFDELCRTLSASDLLLLGDVARLASEPTLARRAYTSARDRFDGKHAAAASFLLGRIAFDSFRDYEGAAREFNASLKARPDGPLARETTGRLLEAYLQSQNATAAMATAKLYLQRYPAGPLARRARAVVAGATTAGAASH